jgi:acylphosphatase
VTDEAVVTQARYVVCGRVQGVGFRWFVLREASALRLGGFVCNLPDGSVEVVARGPVQAVARLERLLERGPSSARVERVEKSNVPHHITIPNSFDVK